MDFHSLSRRQLQTLCKQHKIPANTTNVALATALGDLLNKSGSDTLLQSMVDLLTPSKPTAALAPLDCATTRSARVTRSQRKLQTTDSTESSLIPKLAGKNLLAEMVKVDSSRSFSTSIARNDDTTQEDVIMNVSTSVHEARTIEGDKVWDADDNGASNAVQSQADKTQVSEEDQQQIQDVDTNEDTDGVIPKESPSDDAGDVDVMQLTDVMDEVPLLIRNRETKIVDRHSFDLQEDVKVVVSAVGSLSNAMAQVNLAESSHNFTGNGKENAALQNMSLRKLKMMFKTLGKEKKEKTMPLAANSGKNNSTAY